MLNLDKYGLDQLDRIHAVTGLQGQMIGHQAINLYHQIVSHIGARESFFLFRWGFGNAGEWNVQVGNPPVSRRRRASRYLWPGLLVLVAVGAFLLGRFTA